jgi:hypothetical protein
VTKNNDRKYVPPDQDTCMVYMAPLKRAEVDTDGSLRLVWWRGNEKIKGPQQPPPVLEPVNAAGTRRLRKALNNGNGTVLEGRWNAASGAGCGAGSVIFYGANASLGYQSELIAFEIGVNASMAMNIFLLDHRGNRIKLLESADRAIAKTQALGCHFRVLLRASMAEVYVNDALLLPVPLPHTVGAPSSADPYGTSWAQGVRAPTVAAGLRGSWARAELRAWTMSLPPLFPMPPSDYPGAKTDDGDGFSQDCTFQ